MGEASLNELHPPPEDVCTYRYNVKHLKSILSSLFSVAVISQEITSFFKLVLT